MKTNKDAGLLKQRAWSVFQVKEMDDEERLIEGIATTPSTDRMSDVVEPEGAEFSLPLPFLWQHDYGAPIGKVEKAKVTKDGISVVIRLAKTDIPGVLKDRLDEAWQSIKMGLVRGLSIGFRSIESARIDDTWGVRFLKWEWLELSAVTVPANADATIQTIKSMDRQVMREAASGRKASQPTHRTVLLEAPPGASGAVAAKKAASASLINHKGAVMNKTLSDQLAAFEAKRAANVARMEELMKAAAEGSRSLEADEEAEYDELQAEVESVDKHIKRLKDHQRLAVSTARTVEGNDPDAGTQSRGAAPALSGVRAKANVEKGSAFTRYAIALARSKGNLMQAIQIAERWKDSTPQVITALKAAVDPGVTTDPNWAGALVDVQMMADEFIELLRPATILGRMTGLRRVPFNVKMPRQLSGSTVGWVGQAKPKPVSKLSLDTVTLGFAKVSGIVVISEELAALSTPSAEAVVRQDLIDTVAQFQDEQFIDPAVSLVSNVSPASVTNGVVAVPSTGGTVAQVTADVKALMSGFIAANINLAAGAWVMHPRTALSLSLLRSTSEDTFAFPQITPQGGTFMGLPVITSTSVPVAATTGDPTIIVLANASDILLADEGGINVDVSREASLQMDDDPETGAQSLVSLWQNNLIGLRAERMINWHKRRAAAVQVLTGVTY